VVYIVHSLKNYQKQETKRKKKKKATQSAVPDENVTPKLVEDN
jgi:hypothetical protein